MRKYYAGIGSRKVPLEIGQIMTELASELEEMGYWLRSGGANGSDQYFQSGVKNNAQIWLPRMESNKDFTDQFPQHEYRLVGDHCTCGEPDDEAWDSVEKFHPNFKKMEELGKVDWNKFSTFLHYHSRNYRIVKGLGESDSEFVICWTPEGSDKSGTGQALRIARHYNIPIYNLYDLSKDEILSG